MATIGEKATGEIAYQRPARQPYDRRDLAIVGIAVAAGATCALVASVAHLPRLQPLTGLILIMTITNNREIMGKHVNQPALNILGWSTTAVTLAAALGLIWTWIA